MGDGLGQFLKKIRGLLQRLLESKFQIYRRCACGYGIIFDDQINAWIHGSIRKLAPQYLNHLKIGNRTLFFRSTEFQNETFGQRWENNAMCSYYNWFWFTGHIHIATNNISINQNKWKCAHWISSERDLCFNEFNVYRQNCVPCVCRYIFVAICECAWYTI